MSRPSPDLTPEQRAELARELDALRQETIAQLGAEDARHIRRMVRLARGSAIAGRSLLMFGITPSSWLAGVASLATAKILDNMEIGHNVLHGQYDWMNEPSLQSQTFEWDMTCDEAQWRHSHNYEHHTFTNVLGKDRDVGYGVVRMSDEHRWKPKHLFQPLTAGILTALFQWGIGVHDLEPTTALAGKHDEGEFRPKWNAFKRKVRRQLFKDYAFFPALAGLNAPRVFLGNLAANGIRNVWSGVIIFCGHFPDGARVYCAEEIEDEARDDWYLRQICGSANIEGGSWFHVLSGHLSHQIEHHLFPDVPAHRYPRLAVRVRELCEKYGVPYNSGSLVQQYGSVVRRLFRYSLPPNFFAPQEALSPA